MKTSVGRMCGSSGAEWMIAETQQQQKGACGPHTDLTLAAALVYTGLYPGGPGGSCCADYTHCADKHPRQLKHKIGKIILTCEVQEL